jgi:D-alanyl-D-alanine carboxypeptidase
MTTHPATKNLFATLAALAVFTASYAQSPDKAKLDQFFNRLDEKHKAMGSLNISSNGNTVYTRTIGYRHINGAEKEPLTATTRYRIGSVTKMFTATMIFELVEEGKLKLTDTLSRFFPQIPNAGKITILHLLAHRSGIPDLADGSGRHNPKTQSQILAIIAKRPPFFEPGLKTAYSNTGYIILGYILEKLTGKPYQEALQERITSKLGLKDTYLGAGYTDTSKNESFSYMRLGDWKQMEETHLSIPSGAGALMSTPADQARFIQALFDLKLVSQKSLDQMMRDKTGMDTFTYNGRTFYGHTGGIDNFGSVLVYQPEEKLVVSYTTNAKVYPVAKIIDGIFDIYYNRPFTIPDFEPVAVSPEVLDRYVGVYSNPEAPVKFTVTRDGTRLFIKLPDQSVVPVEATAQDKFKLESLPLAFRFDAAKNEMTVIRGNTEKVFTKEK